MDYRLEAHEILKHWMEENNLSGNYVIHHRNDNDEVITYNTAHYDRWGFNEDGTFEYGKYVIFMTRAEHCKHHHTGKDNVHYGKGPMLGRHFTDEHRRKIGESKSGERNPMFGKPSHRRGKKHSSEALERIRLARAQQVITDETRNKISDSMRTQLESITNIYHIYKQRGGLLKWNSFRSALKNNNSEVVDLISDLLKDKEKIP